MTKTYTRKFTAGGIVVVVEDAEDGVSKTGKGWRKQVLVIDTGTEKYPNPCKVTFWNDKVQQTMAIRKGDEVEFDFYLRGGEYNDRFKVELNGDALRLVAKGSEPEPQPEPEAVDDGGDEIESDPDDMPF